MGKITLAACTALVLALATTPTVAGGCYRGYGFSPVAYYPEPHRVCNWRPVRVFDESAYAWVWRRVWVCG